MTWMTQVVWASLIVLCSSLPVDPADSFLLLQSRLEPNDSPTPERRLRAAMEGARRVSPGTAGSTPSQRQLMVNFGDAQFVSYVYIGKMMIAGIIDTGSFELVVFGSDCRRCSVAAHYNHHLSDSFESGTLRMQHNYGSGATVCDEAFEQVSIGPYTPAKQMFWEVVDAQMPILDNAAFEAIIGVGPTEAMLVDMWTEVDDHIKNLTSYYDRATAPPSSALADAQRLVKTAIQLGNELPMLHTWGVNIFSICMGAESGADGIIIWEDTLAKERPHLFMEIPVMNDHHTWSANMTEPFLEFGNNVELGCAKGCDAIIDSGTSVIAAPSYAVRQVAEAVDRLNTNCSNLEALPDLVFKLGGHTFSLPPSSYVAEVVGEVPHYLKAKMPSLGSSNRACELMIMDMGSVFSDGTEMWILGVPFFRKYYTTFELGNNLAQRKFHIAQHSEKECAPMETAVAMESTRKQSALKRIEAKRLHLPDRSRVQRARAKVYTTTA